MTIYDTHPGLHLICTNCGCLFGFSAQDIYEDKFVYCPACREKLEAGIHEAVWKPAIEPRKEENINEEIANNTANST